MKLLGVRLNAVTMEQLHGLIVRAVEERRRWILGHHNVHSVYLYHHDADMRAFYDKADCVHVDGMALVFAGRLLRLPLQRRHRVTYVDWVRPLMSFAAQRGLRVFYLGSRPGVSANAAERLKGEVPDLQIATHHGYLGAGHDDPANQHALEEIERFQPDILMVGMGMPMQERWIVENAGAVRAPVILTCGACMDYVAGVLPTAPRWLGQVGLEWLFRLGAEPGRLWRRYLLEPWFVLMLLVRDAFRRSS